MAAPSPGVSTGSWVSLVEAAERSSSGHDLNALFSVDLTGPQIAQLQNDIWDHSTNTAAAIQHSDLPSTWPALGELSRAYLDFCRDVDPNAIQSSFDSYAGLLAALPAVYSGPRGVLLNGVVLNLSRSMVTLFGRHRTEALWIAGVLLRIFNSIRSDKEPGANTKRAIVMPVATSLCRLYFWTGKVTQSGYVFNNMASATRSFSSASLAERVEYRYWLGRFHLWRGEIYPAVRSLRWAYSRCYNSSVNKIIILTHLLVPNIMVGVIPRKQVLQALGISDVVTEIVNHLRQPSLTAILALEQHPWIRSMHLQNIIRNHFRARVARRALIRLHKLLNYPQTLELKDAHASLCLAGLVPQQDPEYILTESECVSLVSAGYFKANLLPARGVFRLKPTDPFPSLAEIAKTEFAQTEASEAWLEK